MRNKRETTKYVIYLLAFLTLWIVLFWKCKFGFPLDENFYILFCYRFINGDIPVLHEWNPTQFFVIWIYPFAWVYYKLVGSSEHIILVFRYIFFFVWGISALFFFYRLRKISFFGAAVSSLIFMVFVPYGEMALYYNTIGLISFTSALVIIITAEKKKYLQYMVSGFMFAVAVTCCPFLFSLYVMLIIAVLVYLTKKQRELFRLFCCITVGAIPVIILVYWFYIVPSSLGEVINGLKYLIADRDHQFTYYEKFTGFFKNIYESNPVVLLVTLTVFISMLIALKKKTKKTRIIGFLAVCVSVMLLYVTYLVTIDYTTAFFPNRYSFPPVFVGLYCGMLTEKKTTRKLFYNMYVPGLIYVFCINISSNVVFEASMIPSVICTMATCFLMLSFWKDNIVSLNKGLLNIAGKIICSLVMILCFSIGLYAMITYTYCNGKTLKLKVEIKQGPYKGLVCSQSIQNAYNKVVQDLEPIKNSDSENVLLLTGFWYYLDVNKKPSCSSCFYHTVDDALLDQLEQYYDLYPQFIPDIVYIQDIHKDLLDRVIAYGYQSEETKTGSYILYRKK